MSFYKFDYPNTIELVTAQTTTEIKGNIVRSQALIACIEFPDGTYGVIDEDKRIRRDVSNMKSSKIKTLPAELPENMLVRGTGPDTRFTLVANAFEGYTISNDYFSREDFIDDENLLYLLESTKNFELVYEQDEVHPLCMAIVYEVDLRNEMDYKTRAAMAYLILKEISAITDNVDCDISFGKLFKSKFKLDVDDFVKDNNISLEDTKDIRFTTDFLRQIYNSYKGLTPGEIFTSVLHSSYSDITLSIFRSILRVQQPSNMRHNIKNAMCLFRSFLTPEEFEEMMLQFCNIISPDATSLDQIIKNICDIFTKRVFTIPAPTYITDNNRTTLDNITKEISNTYPTPSYLKDST